MAKVKFNVKSHDRETGKVYPACDDFVEVSDAFAKRLKAYQAENDDRKDWFEFPTGGRPAKDDGAEKKKKEDK